MNKILLNFLTLTTILSIDSQALSVGKYMCIHSDNTYSTLKLRSKNQSFVSEGILGLGKVRGRWEDYDDEVLLHYSQDRSAGGFFGVGGDQYKTNETHVLTVTDKNKFKYSSIFDTVYCEPFNQTKIDEADKKYKLAEEKDLKLMTWVGYKSFSSRSDYFEDKGLSEEEAVKWMNANFLYKNTISCKKKKISLSDAKKDTSLCRTPPEKTYISRSEIQEIKKHRQARNDANHKKNVQKFIDLGVKPEDVRLWEKAGFETVGYQAEEWIKAGFTPGETKRWLAIDEQFPSSVDTYRKKNITLQQAEQWKAINVDYSSQMQKYIDLNISVEEAEKFRKIGITDAEAISEYIKSNLSQETIAAWAGSRYSAEHVVTFQSLGLSYIDVKRWTKEAGVFTPDGIKHCIDKNISMKEAKTWTDDDFNSDEMLYAYEGNVSLAMANEWKNEGYQVWETACFNKKNFSLADANAMKVKYGRKACAHLRKKTNKKEQDITSAQSSSPVATQTSLSSTNKSVKEEVHVLANTTPLSSVVKTKKTFKINTHIDSTPVVKPIAVKTSLSSLTTKKVITPKTKKEIRAIKNKQAMDNALSFYSKNKETVKTVIPHTKVVVNPWFSSNFSTKDSEYYKKTNTSVLEAKKWKKAGFRAKDAYYYLNKKITLTEAIARQK